MILLPVEVFKVSDTPCHWNHLGSTFTRPDSTSSRGHIHHQLEAVPARLNVVKVHSVFPASLAPPAGPFGQRGKTTACQGFQALAGRRAVKECRLWALRSQRSRTSSSGLRMGQRPAIFQLDQGLPLGKVLFLEPQHQANVFRNDKSRSSSTTVYSPSRDTTQCLPSFRASMQACPTVDRGSPKFVFIFHLGFRADFRR